ncbi:unnamed protein product [Vitrella brassicaformis CCMP3155]|uniref:RING-type domain-containing protein n=1 Tax=Vitrella brassicaformis (strain CCMP3155) TaxID=1169540 RepID=A0A0G4EJP7_VITBC|nr:unnamed protein product [Vitrella brassicaformis CCMP3155]|eukprot:CEL96982.1 unnamed protein product [Vitrella brassicaformis CCMP3155]
MTSGFVTTAFVLAVLVLSRDASAHVPHIRTAAARDAAEGTSCGNNTSCGFMAEARTHTEEQGLTAEQLVAPDTVAEQRRLGRHERGSHGQVFGFVLFYGLFLPFLVYVFWRSRRCAQRGRSDDANHPMPLSRVYRRYAQAQQRGALAYGLSRLGPSGRSISRRPRGNNNGGGDVAPTYAIFVSPCVLPYVASDGDSVWEGDLVDLPEEGEIHKMSGLADFVECRVASFPDTIPIERINSTYFKFVDPVAAAKADAGQEITPTAPTAPSLTDTPVQIPTPVNTPIGEPAAPAPALPAIRVGDSPQELTPLPVLPASQLFAPPISASPFGSPSHSPSRKATCGVCFANTPTALFGPCGHGGCCVECAAIILVLPFTKGRRRFEPPCCPVCRTHIDQLLVIEEPEPPGSGWQEGQGEGEAEGEGAREAGGGKMAAQVVMEVRSVQKE